MTRASGPALLFLIDAFCGAGRLPMPSIAARAFRIDGHSGSRSIFRSCAARCAGIPPICCWSPVALGGCSINLGSLSPGAGKARRRSRLPRAGISVAEAQAANIARPGAGAIRKDRGGARRVRPGDRARSHNARGLVRPRLDLPGPTSSISCAIDDFSRSQWPDAAAAGAAARPRDQLSRAGQGQGGRRRPRRGRGGRPAERADMDHPGHRL